MSEPISIPSKKKYKHAGGVVKNGMYRTRTGPNCCNGNCASSKGKSGKKHNARKH